MEQRAPFLGFEELVCSTPYGHDLVFGNSVARKVLVRRRIRLIEDARNGCLVFAGYFVGGFHGTHDHNPD